MTSGGETKTKTTDKTDNLSSLARLTVKRNVSFTRVFSQVFGYMTI